MKKSKELAQRLEQAERQMRVFQRISRFMARDLGVPEVLQEVAELLADALQCDSCLIYLLEGDELVMCASNIQHPSSMGRVALRLDEGLTGWVARERRLLAISREAYHDPRFKYFRDLPEDTFEAFMSVPVIARGRVIGVINIQHREPHQFSGAQMELLTTVGEQLGGLLLLAQMDASAIESARPVELFRTSN